MLSQTDKRGKKRKGKGIEDIEYSLNPSISLRINYDRYGVLVRDELIVKAAEDRWNKGAAEVVRAVLAASLVVDSVLANGRTNKEVGVDEIFERIPPTSHVLLTTGMALTSKKPVTEILRQYLSVLAGEDQIVENGGAFLRRNDATSPGYTVELESVCRRLRATLLTEMVRERLGDKAARVLAVVAKASKVGETTVGS